MTTGNSVNCKRRALAFTPCSPPARRRLTHGQAGIGLNRSLITFQCAAFVNTGGYRLGQSGATFFRREYPGVLAANGRLFGVVREYIQQSGAAFPTREDFDIHLARNQAELESLRRVVQSKLHETRLWRNEALALRAQLSKSPTQKP